MNFLGLAAAIATDQPCTLSGRCPNPTFVAVFVAVEISRSFGTWLICRRLRLNTETSYQIYIFQVGNHLPGYQGYLCHKVPAINAINAISPCDPYSDITLN